MGDQLQKTQDFFSGRVLQIVGEILESKVIEAVNQAVGTIGQLKSAPTAEPDYKKIIQPYLDEVSAKLRNELEQGLEDMSRDSIKTAEEIKKLREHLDSELKGIKTIYERIHVDIKSLREDYRIMQEENRALQEESKAQQERIADLGKKLEETVKPEELTPEMKAAVGLYVSEALEREVPRMVADTVADQIHGASLKREN